jgi:predicted RNA-binding Zn-ribbon protein involved in translation (DUF1610 family)
MSKTIRNRKYKQKHNGKRRQQEYDVFEPAKMPLKLPPAAIPDMEKIEARYNSRRNSLFVTCPACGERFHPHETAGSYLDRCCPECGAALAPKTYDARSHVLLGELKSVEERLAVPAKRCRTLERRLETCRTRLGKAIVGKHLESATKLRLEVEADKTELVDELNACAISRYYTSEFFFATNTYLNERLEKGFSYHVRPVYLPDGAWNLTVESGSPRGMLAEFDVFEALVERARNPQSHLYQARVLDGLYIPRRERTESRRLYDQVDIVVVTKKNIYVLEVSHSPYRCQSFAPFRKITRIGDPDGTGKRSKMLTNKIWQNKGHTDAFVRACPAVPANRFFNQVVLVNVEEFRTDSARFVSSRNVSSMTPRSNISFLTVLEKSEAASDELMTDEAVTSLAEELATKFGDPMHVKDYVHVKRIKSMMRAIDEVDIESLKPLEPDEEIDKMLSTAISTN